MEVLEREINKSNTILTKRNKQLQNYFWEMRGAYILLKRIHRRYLKDNTRLYRMIRLQRLQIKEAKENPSGHPTLETLVEAAVSLQPPETSQVVVNPPSTELIEEES